MPTYRIQRDDIQGRRAVISGATAHHLVRVLRVRSGAAVRCTDGAGTVWNGRIESADATEVVVTLDATEHIAPPRPHITIVAALLPHDRWRYLVEKSVELGAGTIQPVITARTIITVSERAKREKWQAIADAAAEQCDTAWAPRVESALPLAAWLAQAQQFDRVWICHPGSETAASSTAQAESLAIMIGPEGGFTNDEFTQAATRGAHPLPLGPLTLRAETAAVAAIVRMQMREMSAIDSLGSLALQS